MNWITLGALYCVVAVLAGAFGAHGLKQRLQPDALAQWETAARYLIYGGFGLLVMGLLARAWEPSMRGPGLCLAFGTAVFSGTVFSLALGGPRWLGAVTPLGGLGMILGFAWLALQALKT